MPIFLPRTTPPPPLYRRRRVVVKTGYSRTTFPVGVSYGLQSRPLAIASQYLPLTPATPYPDGRGKGKSVLRYNSLQARRIERIKRLRVECTSDKKNNRKEPCARESTHSDNISDTAKLPSWQSKDCRSGGCLYIRNLSIDHLLIFKVRKLGSDFIQA